MTTFRILIAAGAAQAGRTPLPAPTTLANCAAPHGQTARPAARQTPRPGTQLAHHCKRYCVRRIRGWCVQWGLLCPGRGGAPRG